MKEKLKKFWESVGIQNKWTWNKKFWNNFFGQENDEDHDIYIEILEYCLSKEDGFTYNELKNDLGISDGLFRALQWEGREGGIFSTSSVSIDRGHGTERQLFLSFEGRMKLLEYIELNEARRSSRNATHIAIGSILIAIAVALYQIFVPQDVNIVKPTQIKIDAEIIGGRLLD